MAEPVDLDSRRSDLAGSRHRRPTGAYPAERLAMANLIAERILHSANVDGATCSPLLHEEASNLADAVVGLIEECQSQRPLTAQEKSDLIGRETQRMASPGYRETRPERLTPAEILDELRGPLA